MAESSASGSPLARPGPAPMVESSVVTQQLGELRGPSGEHVVKEVTEEAKKKTGPDGETASRRTQTRTTRTQEACCTWTTVARVIAVAVIVAGLAAGVIGLLAYMGILPTLVNAITKEIGLYTLLGGFGATFIVALLLTVSGFLNKYKANGEQGKTGCLPCCNSTAIRKNVGKPHPAPL